jgi:hypothetical protein
MSRAMMLSLALSLLLGFTACAKKKDDASAQLLTPINLNQCGGQPCVE